MLERTKISCRERQDQIFKLRSFIDETPKTVKQLRFHQTVTSMDVTRYLREKTTIPNEERISFGEELILALKENNMKETERFFDSYQSFDIYLPANMDREKPHIYVRSLNGGSYRVEMETEKPLGCTMRIDRLLEGLEKRVEAYENRIKNAEKQKEAAILDLEMGNRYQAEVELLEIRLGEIDKLLSEDDKKSA